MTATYFAFRDDVLTRLLARQAQMQYAYEDRIADLRGQVDRLASRQLLDQEQFESKLEQIARRQATLESRSSALSSLPDPSPTGSIKSAPRASAPAILAAAVGAEALADQRHGDPGRRRPSARRGLNRARRSMPASGSPRCRPTAGIEGALARLQVSLDRFEASQTKTLNTLEESYDAKARRMRSVLADLGLDLGKIAPRAARARDRRPVRAGKRRTASRHSTASSIASSSRAGRSTG